MRKNGLDTILRKSIYGRAILKFIYTFLENQTGTKVVENIYDFGIRASVYIGGDAAPLLPPRSGITRL